MITKFTKFNKHIATAFLNTQSTNVYVVARIMKKKLVKT